MTDHEVKVAQGILDKLGFGKDYVALRRHGVIVAQPQHVEASGLAQLGEDTLDRLAAWVMDRGWDGAAAMTEKLTRSINFVTIVAWTVEDAFDAPTAPVVEPTLREALLRLCHDARESHGWRFMPKLRTKVLDKWRDLDDQELAIRADRWLGKRGIGVHITVESVPIDRTSYACEDGDRFWLYAGPSLVHDGYNVEIEAQAGTRITVHLFDGRVVDTVVPE